MSLLMRRLITKLLADSLFGYRRRLRRPVFARYIATPKAARSCGKTPPQLLESFWLLMYGQQPPEAKPCLCSRIFLISPAQWWWNPPTRLNPARENNPTREPNPTRESSPILTPPSPILTPPSPILTPPSPPALCASFTFHLMKSGSSTVPSCPASLQWPT